jgi:hypothetical protein
MRPHVLLLATVVTKAIAGSVSSLDAAGGCADGFVICAPPGATSTATPQIGDAAFQNLFVDIVQSSLPPSKRSLSDRAVASLCCNALLSCLTITALGLPMCYDKFTTNFFLPDGSYGTVVNGSYTSATGDTANLETGAYTLANGQTGNIYSSDPAAKPNTATLPIPSQFTASGIGSAVPITGLGSPVTLTYTTTLPASAVPPVTISASGSPPSVVPGTTLPASTVSARVTIVTTTEAQAETASTTPSISASKKSAAAQNKSVEGALYLIVSVSLALFL